MNYNPQFFTKNSTLTKRELFAAMALQGFIAGAEKAYHEGLVSSPDYHAEDFADSAVKMADALIKALEK